MPRRKKSKLFDSPFIVGISAVLALLVINAAVFDVPLIPISTANGQSVALNVGMAGIPMLAILAVMLLFVRRLAK